MLREFPDSKRGSDILCPSFSPMIPPTYVVNFVLWLLNKKDISKFLQPEFRLTHMGCGHNSDKRQLSACHLQFILTCPSLAGSN